MRNPSRARLFNAERYRGLTPERANSLKRGAAKSCVFTSASTKTIAFNLNLQASIYKKRENLKPNTIIYAEQVETITQAMLSVEQSTKN